MNNSEYIYKDSQYKWGSEGWYRCYEVPGERYCYCWGWEFSPNNKDYSYSLNFGTWEEWIQTKKEMQQEILDNII